MERFFRRTAAIVAAATFGAVLAVGSALGQNSIPSGSPPGLSPTPSPAPSAAPDSPAQPLTLPDTPAAPAESPSGEPTPAPTPSLEQPGTPEPIPTPTLQPSPGRPPLPSPAVPGGQSAPSGQQRPPAGQGVIFAQQDVDQSRFIAIASPYAGGTSHQLLILEQVSDARPCWSVSGGNPAIVDPLLRGFNFTGICGRSTDSNSYSVRVNGVDMGRQYRLRIINQNQDMVLVADPVDCYQPDRSRCTDPPLVEVGRTNGITPDYAEIQLDPGWRFTRRVLNGRSLGHIYLTYEGVFPPAPIASNPSMTPPTPAPPPATLAFVDIGGDVYADEIQKAVQTGFIAGFENGTFRPQQPLTREQLVSMVLGALQKLPGVSLTIPATVSTNPYKDVVASRWSAARIAFARDNNIVSGYQDGTFQPTKPVTRAEMIAVLSHAAEYGRSLRGLGSNLQQTGQPKTFSDISNHWAASLITGMSAYCNVASPVNESGTAFAPDDSARRNYAAAATLRMYDCVKTATN